ncbi:MAG: bifunctional folylpolyglutamate synthase/dihydrofolate synthase [Deltaproteobacteria bacterium]|nr:bifunctional folylpolyglutamate synthase/dihydrofolate synthase [Deltaproteobacteria bacterium]
MRTHPLLQRLANAGVRLGLQRVEALLEAMGSPHAAMPSLHVAGTNGKGSVCMMLDGCLRAAGRHTGLYTSPHIQQLNERFRIDGRPISDARLDALLVEIDRRAREWAHARGEARDDGGLTVFEAETLAAFLWFAQQELDVAVLEVGLGGRLDATNVVTPEVTCVVSVGLDHTDRLGDTIAAIAAEKAGILKPGVPMVVGPLPKDALSAVRVMAKERGCPLIVAGTDFRVEGSPEDFSYRSARLSLSGLSCGLSGAHQVQNAGVALAMLERWSERRPELAVDEAALRAGLKAAQNPGRFEWLAEDLLIDGAHNVDGARALASALAALPRDRPRTLLLGASKDKDVRAIAAALRPMIDRVFTTSCAHPRAMMPGEVAERLVGLGVPVLPAGPIEDALPMAREGRGLVIVAGSLFLAGAARDLLGRT